MKQQDLALAIANRYCLTIPDQRRASLIKTTTQFRNQCLKMYYNNSLHYFDSTFETNVKTTKTKTRCLTQLFSFQANKRKAFFFYCSFRLSVFVHWPAITLLIKQLLYNNLYEGFFYKETAFLYIFPFICIVTPLI